MARSHPERKRTSTDAEEKSVTLAIFKAMFMDRCSFELEVVGWEMENARGWG